MRALPAWAIAAAALLLTATPWAAAYREGPVPAVTGGFGEPTCQKCHWDNPLNDPAGSLRLEGVPRAYVPGRAYQLRVILRRRDLRRGGFELSARFAAGSPGDAGAGQAGRFVASDPRLQIVSEPGKNVEYIQHTKTGSTPPRTGEQRWTLDWEAPLAAPAAVIFSIAANAANDDNSPLGDFIYTAEITIRRR